MTVMMWGDPIGAATLNQPAPKSQTHINNNLDPNQKKCIASIYQITGPAHIPTTDIRWQELFLSYDMLVHLDRGCIYDYQNINNNDKNNMTIMDQVCNSMAKHARNSSNLAAFAWHISKMMDELVISCKQCCQEYQQHYQKDMNNHNLSPQGMTAKITMVGKARVVCGALNLFRIICHEVITASVTTTSNNYYDNSTELPPPPTKNIDPILVQPNTNSFDFLQEAFTYKSRQHNNTGYDTSTTTTPTRTGTGAGAASTGTSNNCIDTSTQLLSTLLSFISLIGSNQKQNIHGGSNKGRRHLISVDRDDADYLVGNKNHNNTDTGKSSSNDEIYYDSSMDLLKSVPELYDATVLTLMLLTVLFSTQLYQPLQTSFELRDELYNQYTQYNHDGINGNAKTGNGGGSSGLHSGILYKHYFLDSVMQQAYENCHHRQQQQKQQHKWSSQSILSSLLNWIIERPSPPPRSIAGHFKDMVYTIAHDVKGEKVGPDGMFENHAIVMANAPLLDDDNEKQNSSTSGSRSSDKGSRSNENNKRNSGRSASGYTGGLGIAQHRSTPKAILDATNTVLHYSSSLLLLPFRLMTLALRALGHPENFLLRGSGSRGSSEGYDDFKLAQLQAAYSSRGGSNASMASPTNDVLWISDSPVADLGSSIFLVLSNNYRASSLNPSDNDEFDDSGDQQFLKNVFRSDLACLDDNRWDGWDSNSYGTNKNGYIEETNGTFESVEGNIDMDTTSLLQQNSSPRNKILLTINFEHLFQSFRGTLHNELGALTLYTLLQSSPIFAASLAVRSDLDMLVLPLLRTLYYSSTSNQHIAGRTSTASATTTPTGDKVSNSTKSVSVSEYPFRSQSQLYVIMILLLIFSQDTSFGPDSFRRSNIPIILWYKERNLKNISLGSMIVLSLLRCVTFNLNRLHDPFLLSNCCAVLLNLSPHISNLHSYAAQRLASVLVSSMKRYTVLVMKNGGRQAEEGDVSSLLGMYAETCRILLQVVKHSIRRRVVEKNLHLVYSLVYHQRDFSTVLKAKKSPFKPLDTEKISTMIQRADTIISDASARTSEKAMVALEQSMHILKGSKSSKSRKSSNINTMMGSSNSSLTDDSTISTTSSSTVSGMEDFRFTYEEEADPEIFFIPYVWEIIVSCVSASTLEWNKKKIKVFALLEYEEMSNGIGAGEGVLYDDNNLPNQSNGMYAKDEADIV